MFLGNDTLGITYMINKSTLVDHSMLKVLEAYGGSTSNGTNIVNYDAHNGVDAARNQFWVIESTTRTTYKWKLWLFFKFCVNTPEWYKKRSSSGACEPWRGLHVLIAY